MLTSPAHGRALWAMALMAFGAGLSAVALLFSWTQLDIFTRLFAGEFITDEMLTASDDRISTIATAELAFGAAAALAFILWVHRARLALDRLGVQGLKYSSRWAWLGFVVPFINVFRPYQVMSEIWRASELPGPDATEWSKRATPWLIPAWWVSRSFTASLCGSSHNRPAAWRHPTSS